MLLNNAITAYKAQGEAGELKQGTNYLSFSTRDYYAVILAWYFEKRRGSKFLLRFHTDIEPGTFKIINESEMSQ